MKTLSTTPFQGGIRSASLGSTLVLLFAFALAPKLHAATPMPIYQVVADDPTWTQTPGTDIFTVASSAYIYAEEVYELPIEADKWDIQGAIITNDDPVGVGKYYEYIDMKQARWGLDDDYLYVSWETAGDRISKPGTTGFDPEGLNGIYYAYFGLKDGPDFVIGIPGGKAPTLGSSFSDVSNDAGLLFEDLTNFGVSGQDVPGPGGNPADVTTTGQTGTGFDTQNSSAVIEGRLNGFVVELAFDFSSLGFTMSDLSMFDYAFVGTAVSNPSGPNDLFANDHFASDNEGSEYDNVRLGTAIPEPSAAFLAAIAAIALSHRRPKRALR